MRYVAIATGVLVLTAGLVPIGPFTDYNVITIAAPAVVSGGQGVSGRPQKNGTIKAPPKPDASINGSQRRGKH